MANLENDERNTSFIREKIVGSRLNKKELIARFCAIFVCVIILAAIFGAVAGAVFAKVNSMAKPEINETESETLSIPRDDETVPASTEEIVDTTEETEAETAESPSTEETEQEETKSSLENYVDMCDERAALVSSANKALVTVYSQKEHTDWFDNSVEDGVKSSGIIWGKTDKEVFIVTICDSSYVGSELEVSFYEGTYAKAYMKGYDSLNGLAVIGVSIDEIDEKIKGSIYSVALGNSYILSQGDPIILIGNPAGYIGSSLYCSISYIDNMIVTDMAQKGIVTDAYTYTDGNGFALNYAGELVGIYGKEAAGSFTKVYGISDMKGILEKMSNGIAPACLGVKGVTVSDAIAEQYGIVKGIYVTDTENDGAAYQAGIKDGDVIVAVDGESVSAMKALQIMLESHDAGDIVNVTVMRNGAEEYSELVFEVELGQR